MHTHTHASTMGPIQEAHAAAVRRSGEERCLYKSSLAVVDLGVSSTLILQLKQRPVIRITCKMVSAFSPFNYVVCKKTILNLLYIIERG
jgi:hypothetical protein